MLRAGKSVSEVCAAIGATPKSVGKWKTTLGPPGADGPKAARGRPKGPKRVTIPELEKPPGSKKPRLTTFGKARAGSVLSGLFSIVALRLGPGWKLTTEERDMLGESLADCAHLAPAPIVGAVSRFSAPLTFFAQLGSVVQSRFEAAYAEAQAIARQAAMNARVVTAPAPPPDGMGHRAGPGDAFVAPAPAPPNGRMRDRNLG